MLLEKYEQKPEVWRYPLEDELMEANADKDETIVQAAQRLLELLNPQQSAQGKYNVQVGSGQGIVIGDSSSIHQHFYDPPPGEPPDIPLPPKPKPKPKSNPNP